MCIRDRSDRFSRADRDTVRARHDRRFQYLDDGAHHPGDGRVPDRGAVGAVHAPERQGGRGLETRDIGLHRGDPDPDCRRFDMDHAPIACERDARWVSRFR